MSTKLDEERIIEKLFRRCLKQLRVNSHKPHWSTNNLDYHFRRLHEEINELKEAIDNNESRSRVFDEGADVANFIAFILDIYKPDIEEIIKKTSRKVNN